MKPDDQFSRLAKHLVGAYPYEPWPEAPWLAVPESDSQLEQTEALYRECEQSNRSAVEAAVQQWLSGKPWPALTDVQAYLLGVRIDSVVCFLLELSTPDNVLSCAAKPDEELLWWFLIHWWRHHGGARYFLNRQE